MKQASAWLTAAELATMQADAHERLPGSAAARLQHVTSLIEQLWEDTARPKLGPALSGTHEDEAAAPAFASLYKALAVPVCLCSGAVRKSIEASIRELDDDALHSLTSWLVSALLGLVRNPESGGSGNGVRLVLQLVVRTARAPAQLLASVGPLAAAIAAPWSEAQRGAKLACMWLCGQVLILSSIQACALWVQMFSPRLVSGAVASTSKTESLWYAMIVRYLEAALTEAPDVSMGRRRADDWAGDVALVSEARAAWLVAGLNGRSAAGLEVALVEALCDKACAAGGESARVMARALLATQVGDHAGAAFGLESFSLLAVQHGGLVWGALEPLALSQCRALHGLVSGIQANWQHWSQLRTALEALGGFAERLQTIWQAADKRQRAAAGLDDTALAAAIADARRLHMRVEAARQQGLPFGLKIVLGGALLASIVFFAQRGGHTARLAAALERVRQTWWSE